MEPLRVLPEPAPGEGQLGVGVIGLGRKGAEHARRFHDHPDFRVVRVCDPDETRQAIGSEYFGARASADLDVLLTDPAVRLVVIATPRGLRAELAVRCLEAGKATLVEKPLALDSASAERVLAGSRRHGQSLTVAQGRRWDGAFRTALHAVEAGRLGALRQLKLVGWVLPPRAEQKSENLDEVLEEWGVSYLDQALVLARRAPRDVFCVFRRQPSGRLESFLALLRFEDGLLAHVELDRSALAPCAPAWMIGGSLAGYRDGTIFVPEGDELVSVPVEHLPTDSGPFYANLAEHFRHGTPLAVRAVDAVLLARILDALRASAALGRAVQVECVE